MSLARAIALARGDTWRRDVDLALGRTPAPAPDAGATMLGAYGLGNPVITWMLARYPFLLELTPKQITDGLNQPTCREWLGDRSCRRPMVLDLRGERGREVLHWHCTLHPTNLERVRLPRAKAFASPKISLRTLVAVTADGQTVDWQPNRDGDFHVVTEELNRG